MALFKESRSTSSRPAAEQAASYHAVAIRHPKDACQAARDAAGQRYLSKEAPLLPLKDCTQPAQCECRYQHYDDRRAGPRRESEGAPPPEARRERGDDREERGRRREDRLEGIDPEPEPEPESDPLEDTYYDYVSKK